MGELPWLNGMIPLPLSVSSRECERLLGETSYSWLWVEGLHLTGKTTLSDVVLLPAFLGVREAPADIAPAGLAYQDISE